MARAARSVAALWRGDSRLRLRDLLKRILVIRGGALGDFILTLPTLDALRRAFPQSWIEILGYKHIVALADKRFYADATRSIEYGALASFFARAAELPNELASYFSSFDLIISYLFDPDEIFVRNLRRVGADEIVQGPAKIAGELHAVVELAQPLTELGLDLENEFAVTYATVDDQTFANEFLAQVSAPIIALHAGSGSERKNWPLSRWLDFARALLAANETATLLIIGGEADREQLRVLQRQLPPTHIRLLENIPLPQLGAVLARCDLFVGHDSGVSHLAAASGAPSVLMFGPTDARVWAPRNANVRVLNAARGEMAQLPVDEVARAAQELMRIGIST